MQFNVGDKVRFLTQSGDGVVMKIIDDLKLIVLDVDGFERLFLKSDVVLVSEDEHKLMSSITVAPKRESSPNRNRSKPNRKWNAVEIDLHFHEVNSKDYKYTHSEKLNLQLDYFKRRLDESITRQERKLVVIHGVGKGVLKAEVRKILDGYSNIEYHDASLIKYGKGATEVVIY